MKSDILLKGQGSGSQQGNRRGAWGAVKAPCQERLSCLARVLSPFLAVPVPAPAGLGISQGLGFQGLCFLCRCSRSVGSVMGFLCCPTSWSSPCACWGQTLEESPCSLALLRGLALLSAFTLPVEIGGWGSVFTHSQGRDFPGNVSGCQTSGSWGCLSLLESQPGRAQSRSTITTE